MHQGLQKLYLKIDFCVWKVFKASFVVLANCTMNAADIGSCFDLWSMKNFPRATLHLTEFFLQPPLQLIKLSAWRCSAQMKLFTGHVILIWFLVAKKIVGSNNQEIWLPFWWALHYWIDFFSFFSWTCKMAHKQLFRLREKQMIVNGSN